MKWTSELMRGFLALVVVFGFFGIMLIVLGKPDMRDTVLYMAGQLSGAFMAVIAFHFGTTKSSARKDELLANSTPMPTGNVITQQTTNTESTTEAKDVG